MVNQYGAAGKNGNGVLVNRDGGFEFQRASSSPSKFAHFALRAYTFYLQDGCSARDANYRSATRPCRARDRKETRRSSWQVRLPQHRSFWSGALTLVRSGALSDVQNKVPAEAFGEPTVTPAGNVADQGAREAVAAA